MGESPKLIDESLKPPHQYNSIILESQSNSSELGSFKPSIAICFSQIAPDFVIRPQIKKSAIKSQTLNLIFPFECPIEYYKWHQKKRKPQENPSKTSNVFRLALILSKSYYYYYTETEEIGFHLVNLVPELTTFEITLQIKIKNPLNKKLLEIKPLENSQKSNGSSRLESNS